MTWVFLFVLRFRIFSSQLLTIGKIVLVQIAQRTTKCECPVQCNRTVYEPVLSYAQLSKFNLDRVALSNSTRKKAVEEQYLLAMETSQRVVEEIALKDEDQIGNVLEEITHITKVVNATKPAFENGVDFAEFFAVHDIFSETDKTFENEQKIILGLTDNLKDTINAFGTVVPQNLKILEFLNKVKYYFEIDDEGKSQVYDKMEDCFEEYDYYDWYSGSDSDYNSWYSTSDWYNGSEDSWYSTNDWYTGSDDSWHNTSDWYNGSDSDYSDSWYSSYSYYYPWYNSWYSSYDPL